MLSFNRLVEYSLKDAFDGDDTLLYEPTQTVALILTGKHLDYMRVKTGWFRR